MVHPLVIVIVVVLILAAGYWWYSKNHNSMGNSVIAVPSMSGGTILATPVATSSSNIIATPSASGGTILSTPVATSTAAPATVAAAVAAPHASQHFTGANPYAGTFYQFRENMQWKY